MRRAVAPGQNEPRPPFIFELEPLVASNLARSQTIKTLALGFKEETRTLENLQKGRSRICGIQPATHPTT